MIGGRCQIWQGQGCFGSQLCPSCTRDYLELLGENARLKEQLESHAPEGHNVTNEQFVNLRLKLVEFAQENARLKNAIAELKGEPK